MVNYKKDFPLLRDGTLAYLDNAATAQRPQMVLDAVREYYEKANANPLRGLYRLAQAATDNYEGARARVARFLHARQPEEIIFTRNATESLNLVAYTYGLSQLKAGGEILITMLEHHSNILPWQMVARQTGAKLRFLECDPDGTFPSQRVAEAVTAQTKLVAVTQTSNVLGCLGPVEELTKLVHQNGGVVVVDAAQSSPHMPIHVEELDCDFLAFSGHKLMAPMGIGVLYGKREWLERLPPFLTGGEMIETVRRDGATWAEVPHKFEAGTVNGGGAAGLAAALDYLEGVGWGEIQARERALTQQAFDGLKALPHVHILGGAQAEDHHGILSFTLDGIHPHDVSALFDEDGVCVRAGHHCAQPLLNHLGLHASTRVSLAFYNTQEDVERMLQSLKTMRRRMGYAQ